MTIRNKFRFARSGQQTMASVVLALSIGVLATGVLLGLQDAKATAESPGSSSAKPTTVYERTDGWSLKTLDGKTMAFADFQGKVVFLNFWATWCIPCVEEMPSIQRLAGAMKDQDVAFLLVTDEKEEKVRLFLEKHRMDLPVYVQCKKAPDVFRTKRLPVTYILDREGNIAMRRTGSTEWDDPVCKKFIRDLTTEAVK